MLRAMIEPARHLSRVAGCVLLSAALHATLIGTAVVATRGNTGLPASGQILPALYLVALDRKPSVPQQQHLIPWSGLGVVGALGGEAGLPAGEGRRRNRTNPRGTGGDGEEGVPLPGPITFTIDSVYSVLEVDVPIERYPTSAAPAYPPDLLKSGVEGMVLTQYVVDTVGRVDATTIRILASTNPEFTASVLQALPAMRFRPAVNHGRKVRVLVEQRFSFVITPPTLSLR